MAVTCRTAQHATHACPRSDGARAACCCCGCSTTGLCFDRHRSCGVVGLLAQKTVRQQRPRHARSRSPPSPSSQAASAGQRGRCSLKQQQLVDPQLCHACSILGPQGPASAGHESRKVSVARRQDARMPLPGPGMAPVAIGGLAQARSRHAVCNLALFLRIPCTVSARQTASLTPLAQPVLSAKAVTGPRHDTADASRASSGRLGHVYERPNPSKPCRRSHRPMQPQ